MKVVRSKVSAAGQTPLLLLLERNVYGLLAGGVNVDVNPPDLGPRNKVVV